MFNYFMYICAQKIMEQKKYKYQKEIDAFRNISAAIGDSLSDGTLANGDGQKTATSTNGHFDFFEYEGCDLNKTFLITKKLNNDEKD